MQGNNQYLSPAQACKELDICKQTLYNWHRICILVPVKIHPQTNYRYYSKEQIEEFKNKTRIKQQGNKSMIIKQPCLQTIESLQHAVIELKQELELLKEELKQLRHEIYLLQTYKQDRNYPCL